MKRLAVGVLALAGALIACHSARQPEEPSAVVARFFAAVDGRDCEATKKMVAGGLAEWLDKKGCQAFFDQFAADAVRFEATGGVHPDGRAANAELVETRVSFRGHERTHLVRVEHAGPSWRMSRL